MIILVDSKFCDRIGCRRKLNSYKYRLLYRGQEFFTTAKSDEQAISTFVYRLLNDSDKSLYDTIAREIDIDHTYTRLTKRGGFRNDDRNKKLIHDHCMDIVNTINLEYAKQNEHNLFHGDYHRIIKE